MRKDLRDVGKPCLSRLYELPDGKFRGFAIELANFIAPLSLPLGELMHDVLEVFFQLFNGGLSFFALRFRPGPEFFRRNGLTVLRWGEREAHGGTQNDDVFRSGLLV